MSTSTRFSHRTLSARKPVSFWQEKRDLNFLKCSFPHWGAMARNQLSNQTREIKDLASFKFEIP